MTHGGREEKPRFPQGDKVSCKWQLAGRSFLVSHGPQELWSHPGAPEWGSTHPRAPEWGSAADFPAPSIPAEISVLSLDFDGGVTGLPTTGKKALVGAAAGVGMCVVGHGVGNKGRDSHAR